MIEVAAALIINEEKVLIARKKEGKPLGGYWEFPGGKIEQGETHEECLKRELKEEMGIEIEVHAYIGASEYDYGDKVIRLFGYTAVIRQGEIYLSDHDCYEWVEAYNVLNYKLAPADIPLARRYLELRANGKPRRD